MRIFCVLIWQQWNLLAVFHNWLLMTADFLKWKCNYFLYIPGINETSTKFSANFNESSAKALWAPFTNSIAPGAAEVETKVLCWNGFNSSTNIVSPRIRPLSSSRFCILTTTLTNEWKFLPLQRANYMKTLSNGSARTHLWQNVHLWKQKTKGRDDEHCEKLVYELPHSAPSSSTSCSSRLMMLKNNELREEKKMVKRWVNMLTFRPCNDTKR